MGRNLNKPYMEEIDLRDVVNNPWNSNVMSPENEAKLTESLRMNGSFKPIVVRHLGNGTYEIIGGEHRAKVARKLGNETIQAVVHEAMTDDMAKKISIADNARYGADDGLKLSELISSLEDPTSLSDFLPYSDSEVEVLISSTNIDLDTLNMLDDDDEIDVPQETEQVDVQTHTIMRFKVAIEDSNAIQDIIGKIIKKQKLNESDSLTNAGDALVYALMKGRGGNE